MNGNVALSGSPEVRPDIDLHGFTRAFIAGLVMRDHIAVRPQSPNDRRGFATVVELLDNAVDELEAGGGDRKTIRQLMRIANQLRPSSSGAFDGFEAALRSMQLTLANSPNPFYEEIAFSFPRLYAQATVETLPDLERTLVERAAEAFIKEASSER